MEKEMKFIMKCLILIISIILIILIFTGCTLMSKKTTADKSTTTAEKTTDTLASTVSSIDKNDTIESIISKYCDSYLSEDKHHAKEIDRIKDIVTDSYYNSEKNIESYIHPDKDFEQSTTLKKIYYSTMDQNTKFLSVAALCDQSLLYNNKSSAYSIFYIFDIRYDENKGWLINDCTRSDI